jgi:hypothetical protein
MTSIITKNVDTSSQKKLLEIAAAHAKQQRSADEQAALAQGAQIEAAQKRFREAFWKEINKHPDGSRIQADAHAAARALKALASEKPDKNTRTKRIKSVRDSLDETEKKYRRELINTAAKSAINDDAYLAAVLNQARARQDEEERAWRVQLLFQARLRSVAFAFSGSNVVRPRATL